MPLRAELAKAAALQVPTPGSAKSFPAPGRRRDNSPAISARSRSSENWLRSNPTLRNRTRSEPGLEQQNAARTTALSGIQPTGAPEAVGNTVRQRMAAIEASHDAAVASATTDAQNAASGIGTGAAPEDVGANPEPRCKGPGTPPRAKSASYGAGQRPDGTLALPAAPIATGAAKIADAVPSTAKPWRARRLRFSTRRPIFRRSRRSRTSRRCAAGTPLGKMKIRIRSRSSYRENGPNKGSIWTAPGVAN